MSQAEIFSEINEVKADMDHIYNRADPRPYYRELKELGYRIPGEAKPVFSELAKARGAGQNVTFLDVGCSYGVNAALLRHTLTMDDLYERWAGDELSDASRDDVVSSDRRFFRSCRNDENISVLGLDPADQAIGYAEEVGLLEAGFALDLESEPVPAKAARKLGDVDIVASTGCVGYVTEKSFERLLPAVASGRPAWVANFVLRMFPFDAIEACLDRHGYVTEKLPDRRFVQRRFASDEERREVIGRIEARGLEPSQEERDGFMVAEFFLSRPREEAAARPIGELL